MAETNLLLTVIIVITGVVGIWFVNNRREPIDTNNINLNSTYDYIIVGAGSAGAVLAYRLSEDPTKTVLILEAGGSDESNEPIDIPLAAFSLVGSEIDWGYVTVPQKEALRAHNDNRNLVPRGRVLGGTSSLNHLAYVRGSRHDYDQWAAEGCDGWAYRDVLPYFIKSEDVRAEWLKNSPYHGKGGPLAVSPGQVTDLNKYYAKAMKELGYDNVDCNGKSQIGYEPITLTVKDGARCSTAYCFLKSAAHRPNLHISTNYYVTKVLMEEKTAFGIDFIRGNRKQSVHARKEVILSAGSINSPQILMVSGIGPKKHLQSLKIPVVADLPVGQNLQDHIFVPIVFFPNVSLTITPERVNTLWNIIKYKTTGKGYLSTSGLEGTSFINTDDKSSDAYANIQISFVSAFFPALEKGFATSKLNFKQEIEDIVLKMADDNRNGFTLLPTLLRPKSRGTVTLQSSDPFEPPVIDPQYLTEREDMETLLKDASVMRNVVSGNTNAPTIMIAEKAADLIKGVDTVSDLRQKILKL